MKTKFAFVLAAFIVAFASCQKDKNDDTDNGGTTTDYQPTSVGSTWQYNSTSQGVYTETAVSGDTTIEGDKYYIFDNTENGRRYVNKNNGNYTSYGYVAQLDTAVKLLYLKDAAAGTSWTNTALYSGIPVTLTYNIASRDASMTVNNKNFDNVIGLTFTVGAPNPITGQNITIATGKQFYAKGVGSIMSTLHLKVQTVDINDSTYLVAYDIK